VEDSIGRGLIFEVEKGFWESRPIPHRKLGTWVPIPRGRLGSSVNGISLPEVQKRRGAILVTTGIWRWEGRGGEGSRFGLREI
jgi:hypothetical protein